MLVFQDWELEVKLDDPIEINSIVLFVESKLCIGFIFTNLNNYQFFVDEGVLFMSPEDVDGIADVEDILDIKEAVRFTLDKNFINEIIFNNSKLELKLSSGQLSIEFDDGALKTAKYTPTKFADIASVDGVGNSPSIG